ncbi:hypothetical protein BY458DRAFT_525085 [Sporodiniella umbellata]|nr:hypothetical protein BY458DRAFT_525085 [Sporodiniella umbellata]
MVSLQELLKQEEVCQFSQFTSKNALDLGLLLLEKVQVYNKPVVIDITLNGRQLFHYAMQGTNADNDEWVRRKNNVVNRFSHSSFYMGQSIESQGKTLREKYYINEEDYATHGGAFPLIIRNVGVVGTITVSGLAQQDDHNLVVASILEFTKQADRFQ